MNGTFGSEEAYDDLAVDRSPFGGSDDIPAEVWGDSETFDAKQAADLLGEMSLILEAEVSGQ